MIGLHEFHFLRPFWLAALPPLWALVYWLYRRHKNDGNWSDLIDADLLPALRLDDKNAAGMRPWQVLFLLWTLAVLALAGPSWEKDNAAAYRAGVDWVFVLDLSPSMKATDIKPSRIARARYALDDLLDAARDARVGLVVFSDEPYTVVPLTNDVATVKALLPPLSPDIMPSAGDHLAPALEQAGKLLQAGNAKSRRIAVLTDGIDDPAASLDVAAGLKSRGITVSIIGMGNAVGPLKQLANTGGMRQYDIALQGFEFVFSNTYLGKCAETGINAIDDAAFVNNVIDNLLTGGDFFIGRRWKPNGYMLPGHGAQRRKRNIAGF